MKRLLFLFIAVIFLLSGCSQMREDFTIISGSENKSLEPILVKFGKKHGYTIKMKYKGSVDIMMELQRDPSHSLDYDGVWPANRLWITLGDTHRRIKHDKSIMNSPVVLGIKKSKAEELGFVGRDVRIKDILDAIESGKLSFIMTSATQSNSGASAYLGFLYALAGNPDMLTENHLNDPDVQRRIRSLLRGIERTSGSSGWLKELYLKGDYDAMMNYESMIIEANQELRRQGREELYAVYPVDAIVFSDSPLGYIDQGDREKEKFFLKLQEHLLSEDIQQRLLDEGRRVAFGAIAGTPSRSVFNPDLGFDLEKVLTPIQLPRADVLYQALNLFQGEFRKPSHTLFCLDFSGSMSGEGVSQLRNAMQLLLDQEQAAQYFLNASNEDIIEVIPFSSNVLAHWKVSGNNPSTLSKLLSLINRTNPGGSTDIYSPAIHGLETLTKINSSTHFPAIILMTDGESNVGSNFDDFKRYYEKAGKDIPVFAIMFGNASPRQLEEITELTRGRVFDGRKDLLRAFRKAKGYN